MDPMGYIFPNGYVLGSFVLLDSLSFNDSNMASDDFCEHPGSLDPLGGQILGDVLGHFFSWPSGLTIKNTPEIFGFFS